MNNSSPAAPHVMQGITSVFLGQVLAAELDSAKQKLSYYEAERAAKCKQEHTIEAEIADLLQQKYELEDELKDMSRKLEDARTKHKCSTQDVINLRMMVEKIRYA